RKGNVLFLHKEANVHSLFSTDQTKNSSYHLITEKMTWYEAQSYCRKNYTDLVSIENQTQNEDVRKEGMKSSDFFWIGLLHDDWEWADGGRSAYRNWLAGSPQIIPGRNCVHLEAGKWQTASCIIIVPGTLCYKDQTDLTFSYHLITENKTWYEAQSYCRKNYTDLVSIRDQEQNEKVRKEGMKSSTLFWIGLLRDDWQWADGGRSAYRNWGPLEPRPSTTTSDCTQLKNGTWQAVTCSSNVNAVMCYRATESHNRTFHLIVKSMNQSEARAACRENYTDLATVHNDIENAELINQIKTSDELSENSKVWIGLQRSNYSFKWSNGDNDNKLKNLFGSCWKMPCCAAMTADASWDNITCTETRNFMCYKQGKYYLFNSSELRQETSCVINRVNAYLLINLSYSLTFFIVFLNEKQVTNI
ncbi:macrophage mannose receptor 1-like, partial [Astyanax mexicanus]